MKTLASWKPGITSVEHWDTGADQTGTRHRRALLGVRLQGRQRRVGNETRAEAGATGVQQRSAPLVTEPADGIGCCGLDSEPCSRAGSRAGERADAVGSGK